MNSTTNIIGIVITYQPSLKALDCLLRALLPQVSEVVIVDNCSGIDLYGWINQSYGEKLHVIFLRRNFGIAAAQNVGIAWARKRMSKYVLFTDQDSIPQSGMVAELLRGISSLKQQGRKIAAVGPRYYNPNNHEKSNFISFDWFGFRHGLCPSDERWVRCDFLLSSGSLICVEAIQSIGLMDEGLFIDHVDTEWCIRAQSKGFEVYGVMNALLEHTLGEHTSRMWFFRWRNVSRHKPFRYYYIVRNSILLLSRQYVSSARRRREVLRLLQVIFFFGLIRYQRWQNLTMMWRGFIDGLKGRTGSKELIKR